MGIIRAVEPRPFPDEDAKLFFVNTDNTINVVYGACEVAAGKSDIAVDFPEKGVDHMEIRAALAQQLNPKSFVDIKDLGSFLAPWPNFLGIGVDSRYLWVFRAGAIACVTHTSVNQCLREKTPAPPWIEYKIPPTATSVEFDPDSFFTYYGRFYPRGLREICSCEDGTITARIRESIEDRYVYHLVPHIDRHARPPTLVIESTMTDTNGKWVSDSSISAYNLVKQPIFCWPMIEGLMTALQMTVTPVSIDFEDNSTHTVTVKNNSGNPLSIRGVLGGDHPGDFVLSPMLEETLAAGKSRDFEVGFKSMLPSLRMATLWIESGTKNISVILRGNT